MANKKLFLLLGALCCLITCNLSATDFSKYSLKTYQSHRPIAVNTAMEYTLWHEHAYKPQKNTVHTHLQMVPFYQHTQRAADLGKYFNAVQGRNNFMVVKPAPLVADAPKPDIEAGYFIHEGTTTDKTTLKGNVAFDPYQEVYGVRLDLFQEINHPFANLFFKATAPIVSVSHDMGMKITDAAPAKVTTTGTTQKEFSLAQFFAGEVEVADATSSNLQSPLEYAKINDRRSAFGVADLDVSLGYKYLNDEKKHVFFSLDLTIPTGNKTRGYYLNEPIYGNGRHVGIGGSLDIGCQIWKVKNIQLSLLWTTRYKYLFENTEVRTLSIKGLPLGHYYLAGYTDQKDKALFPLANVLTQGIKVKPGNLFDSTIDFAFHGSNVTIDMGYNMFWKDHENVYIKHTYGNDLEIAKADYNTYNTKLDSTQTYKHAYASDLDVTAATTPTLFTHKLFAGLGYSWTMYKKCLGSVGIGGSYEFATSNADLENYAFWAKFDVSF
jgi:hypothetical protein